MPITEILKQNAQKYGGEIALVEINPEIREDRRVTWKEYELIERGTPQTFEDVLRDMIERDERDKNRPTAPLRQAEDAVLLDTTGNELQDSIDAVLQIVREKFAE